MDRDYTQLFTPRRLKIYIITFALVIAGLVIFNWFYSHAFVELNLSNQRSGVVHIELVEQSSQKTTGLDSAQPTVKKLVHTGSYEVHVQQNNTTYFGVIKVGRFLGKTVVSTRLQSEQLRKFVGDNPGTCMYYSGTLLATSNCNGLFNSLNLHLPASKTQPTIVQKNRSTIDGIVEGTVKTSEGVLLLLQSGEAGPHTVYQLQDDFSLANGRVLPELDQNKSYAIHAYGQGFVAYDPSLSQIFYYTSASAKPSRIQLTKPGSVGDDESIVSIKGDSIIVMYSVNSENIGSNSGKEKVETTILVNTHGTNKQLTLRGTYAAASLCGSKLCLLRSKKLEVYDISGAKQQFLYELENVEELDDTNNGLLVVNDKGVVDFDVDNRSGFMSYSFGDYSFCGLQVDFDASGFVMCLTNNSHKKVALHINQKASDTDSIDKKIADLLKVDQVANVSIYDKYIFISPRLGDLVYVDNEQSFDYDPAVKKQASDAINQALQNIGINRSTYAVVNVIE